jgi:hypothetical protein
MMNAKVSNTVQLLLVFVTIAILVSIPLAVIGTVPWEAAIALLLTGVVLAIFLPAWVK